MSNLLWLLADFGAALVGALVLCRLMMIVTFKDAPTEARKTQAQPVPTAGGVGVAVAALAAAWGFADLAHVGIGLTVMSSTIGATALLLVGWADDRFKINATVKLVIMLVVAVALSLKGVSTRSLYFWPDVHWIMPYELAVALWVLWLIVVVNAVNFMDGANGLSMGMAAVAAFGFMICGIVGESWDVALVAGGLAGGLAGFLVWNVQGKLFAGDAGALFVGVMLGGLTVELIHLRPEWLWTGPTLLLPFLTDVLLTLAWRAKHKKSLFKAHRDHAYQIALKAPMKHWQVAAIHAFYALNALLFGVFGAIVGGWAPIIAFFVLLAISVMIHLRVRHEGVKAGLVGADVA